MKRLFSLRNKLRIALVLSGFLVMTSSFTFGPTEDARLVGNDNQQQGQRIKVMVSVDGKVTKIDTTFNLPDDSIISYKVDSMVKKLDPDGMACSKSGRSLFRLDRFHRMHHHNLAVNPGDKQFDIQIQEGDSGKINAERKAICIKGFDQEFMGDDADELLPPPPPLPPDAQFMIHQRFGGDPFAFDTRDESVVSYEKKDLGNGLEKITIIRKKHDEQHPPRKETKVKMTISKEATK